MSKTKVLRFYGSSDDNFVYVTDVAGPSDEIGCFSDAIAAYTVKTPDGAGLQVFGTYAPDCLVNAVWGVGVAPLDEDVPLPDWPTEYVVAERGYSAELRMTVPVSAKVTANGSDEE